MTLQATYSIEWKIKRNRGHISTQTIIPQVPTISSVQNETTLVKQKVYLCQNLGVRIMKTVKHSRRPKTIITEHIVLAMTGKPA